MCEQIPVWEALQNLQLDSGFPSVHIVLACPTPQGSFTLFREGVKPRWRNTLIGITSKFSKIPTEPWISSRKRTRCRVGRAAALTLPSSALGQLQPDRLSTHFDRMWMIMMQVAIAIFISTNKRRTSSNVHVNEQIPTRSQPSQEEFEIIIARDDKTTEQGEVTLQKENINILLLSRTWFSGSNLFQVSTQFFLQWLGSSKQ